MATKDLGAVTAYAYAVAHGYTGTEEEFEAAMGQMVDLSEEFGGFTAEAETLLPGSQATASYSNGVLTLGIPRGDKGDFVDKIYGVKWDRLTNLLTRTRDAVGITTTTTNFCHKGSINANYSNPFDAIYPWSDMIVCNVDLVKYRTGAALEDCIVAVYGDPDFTYKGTKDLFVGRYRPEFYYRSEEDTNGNVEFMISGAAHAGFKKSPAAVDGISFCVDAGKNASNQDVVTSSGGEVVLTNIAVSSIHSRAKNSGFTLQDIYTIDQQIMLYLVEYANMNIQSALGDGCSSCYRENATDSIASVSTDSTAGTTTITIDDSALSGVIYKGSQIDIGASAGATTYRALVKDFSVSGTVYTIVLDRVLDSVTTGMIASVHGFGTCEFPLLGQSLGHASGYLGTNSKANVFYRGALLFANRYSYTLGIYRKSGTNHLWLCPETLDPDDYDAVNTSVHTDTGVALPELESGAWLTVGGNAQRIPGIMGFMATGTSSGSSSSPVGDQQYVPTPSTGDTILLFGGYAYFGWGDGVFFGAWDLVAGDSSWARAGLPILKQNVL